MGRNWPSWKVLAYVMPSRYKTSLNNLFLCMDQQKSSKIFLGSKTSWCLKVLEFKEIKYWIDSTQTFSMIPPDTRHPAMFRMWPSPLLVCPYSERLDQGIILYPSKKLSIINKLTTKIILLPIHWFRRTNEISKRPQTSYEICMKIPGVHFSADCRNVQPWAPSNDTLLTQY